MPAIVTQLWFDGSALEAAEFYCGIFPDSEVTNVQRAPAEAPGMKEGDVMVVEFVLDGTPFVGFSNGAQFPFSEAMSLDVRCADQTEVDHFWAGLTVGGQELQCGWLKDRFGVSWQVAPTRLGELMAHEDPEVARRVAETMMKQVKIDIAELEAAAPGER